MFDVVIVKNYISMENMVFPNEKEKHKNINTSFK